MNSPNKYFQFLAPIPQRYAQILIHFPVKKGFADIHITGYDKRKVTTFPVSNTEK